MEEIRKEKEEWESKLAAQKAQNEDKKKKESKLKDIPQLRNINQDPSMSGFFKYALREGDNSIGKKIGDFEPDVVISGVGIAKEQCKIIYNP
jgi:UDP-N-acetyl-D-mannosaminuronic acid transferase (WecB/TagA/CpsF family)